MDLRSLSLIYITSAIAFLLLAGVSGALGGIAILNGGMMGAIPGSKFISIHLTLGHLGWVVMALIGLFLGLCYATKTNLDYGYKWFKSIYWVYLAGIISTVVLISLGYGNENRYGEITWPFAVLLMASLGIFLTLIINLFKQAKETREIAIYYFIICLIFIKLYFGILALPLTGIALNIGLNIGTHFLFDGMMLAIMGLSIYILPRLVGRKLYSEMLAIVQLWMVLMMILLTSGRHVIRLNLFEHATNFWIFFYNSLAVVFICVYFFNIYMTIRGAKPKEDGKYAYWSLIFSNIYLGIVAFQGLWFLYAIIYHGEGAPKMLITLHSHFALFGFVTLGIVGALFYFLPKLVQGFTIDNNLIKGIFYTLNGGMLLSFISTSFQNISPANAHFTDSLNAETLKTYYISAQYIGDLLLLITSFLIAWAVAKKLIKENYSLPVKRLGMVLVLTLGLIIGSWWPAPFSTTLAQSNATLVAVANEGDGTVSIIDGSTGGIVRLINTGGAPHNVNYDPLGRYLWVTDHSEKGRLLGYSLESLKLEKEIHLPGAAGHVVPSYDGNYLYVSVEGNNQVVVVETETFKIVREIDTEMMPHGLVISEYEDLMLVPNMMSDTVSVIDLQSGEILETIYVCKDSMPVAMGITSGGDKAYVSLAGTDQVAEIDVKKMQVARTLNLPGTGEIGPIQLPVHPNGKFVYVPSMSEGKAFKIELEQFELVGAIETGAGAHGIAYSHGGRYAYVTNTYENTVTCIDTTTDEVVFTEPVGIAPNGVAVLYGKNQGW